MKFDDCPCVAELQGSSFEGSSFEGSSPEGITDAPNFGGSLWSNRAAIG